MLVPDVSGSDTFFENPQNRYERLESRIRASGFIYFSSTLILDVSGTRNFIERETGRDRVFC